MRCSPLVLATAACGGAVRRLRSRSRRRRALVEALKAGDSATALTLLRQKTPTSTRPKPTARRRCTGPCAKTISSSSTG